jgi:hypothetical protein
MNEDRVLFQLVAEDGEVVLEGGAHGVWLMAYSGSEQAAIHLSPENARALAAALSAVGSAVAPTDPES